MNKYLQFFLRSFRKEPAKEPAKNVALVLGGGGARGFAHIGAIEALEAHGYKITSIAGTSMGALVGGLYVCGKLDKAKEIILGLSRKKILSFIDISPGLDHIATADKLTELITSLTDNVPIEHLPITLLLRGQRSRQRQRASLRQRLPRPGHPMFDLYPRTLFPRPPQRSRLCRRKCPQHIAAQSHPSKQGRPTRRCKCQCAGRPDARRYTGEKPGGCRLLEPDHP